MLHIIKQMSPKDHVEMRNRDFGGQMIDLFRRAGIGHSCA